MVQIIQPVISQKTARQQAMQSGFDQAGQGVANFLGALENQSQTKRQQALDIMNATVKLRESGYDVTPEQVQAQYFPQETRSLKDLFVSSDEQPVAPTTDLLAKRTPEYLQKQEDIATERALKKAQLEDLSKPFGATKDAQKMLFAEDIAARKAKRENELKKQKFNVPEFELASDDYAPTASDVETLKKANKVSKDMANIVNSLAANVKEYGISSGTGATKGGQAVERDISNLIIAVKEAANLGALSGPDMELAEAAIGRLRGGIDMLNPFNTREDAVTGLADIIKKANDKVETEAAARGFIRKGKAPEFKNPYIEQLPSGNGAPDLKSQVKQMSDEELMGIIQGK